jgi:hypothetical protein
VQVHPGQQGVPGGPAAGEQGADQAGEHVTHAGRGHGRVAGGVDPPGTIGPGDHAAAALEHHPGLVAAGQGAGGGDAVGLHCGSVAAQQAGGFGRVGGEYGRLGTPGQGGLQVGVSGQQIEGVGIQHQGRCRRQGRGHQGAGRVGLAQARAHGEGSTAGFIKQRVGAAEHQLGA